MPARRRRGAAFWALYGLYLVLFLTAVNYAVYWRYYRRISGAARFDGAPPPAGLDALTASRLGNLAKPRAGSFADFARAKPSGTIRIGCFGDSFTYGSEVRAGREYAGILQTLLRRYGVENAEVLNFGNPGFGFHQTFMMYDLVGREYGLDYAVFLPFPELWRTRDVSFTFWEPPAPSLGLHARYVLRRNHLDLIDPVGDSEGERFQRYNAFLPPLRYLRYDSRPPALLRAWLPAGRTVANPFYHRSDGDLAEEADETYRAILSRLAASRDPRTIVLDVQRAIKPLAARATRDRLNLVSLAIPKSFPYSAPNNHYSAWGHELLAEHLLRVLGVKRGQPIPLLRPADLSDGTTGAAMAPRGELDSVERVSVDIDDQEVGTMYRFRPASMPYNRVKTFPPEVRYLVIVPVSQRPLVDGLVLGLAAKPADPQVTAEEAGTTRRLDARIVELGPGVGRLDLCSAGIWAGAVKLTDPLRCIVPPTWDQAPDAHDVTIRIGGEVRLSVGVDSNGLRYKPAGAYFRFAALRLAAAGTEALKDRGAINLSFHRSAGETIRIPIGSWTRADIQFRPARILDLGN